jgi:hypothetical protein
MVRRGKSTRWDCDARLWRGIPDRIPRFHGWHLGEPVQDSRFVVCHHCRTYVPQGGVWSHPCWDIPDSDPGLAAPAENDATDEEPAEETPRKYVVATEENAGDNKCRLCGDRTRLEVDQDLEDWIYPDCVLVLGRVLHEECHRVVSEQGNLGEDTSASYVVHTEENEGGGGGNCYLCASGLRCEFDPGLEKWIYPDCVEVLGRVLHRKCHAKVCDVLIL